MKPLFLFLLGLTCLAGQAQKLDTMAVKMVESNLDVISQFLEKKEKSLQRISDAVGFLTDLTGIVSQSDGNYYAQFNPTANDLKAWTAWLKFNREFIFWDKELKAVILYKKVKPLIN